MWNKAQRMLLWNIVAYYDCSVPFNHHNTINYSKMLLAFCNLLLFTYIFWPVVLELWLWFLKCLPHFPEGSVIKVFWPQFRHVVSYVISWHLCKQKFASTLTFWCQWFWLESRPLRKWEFLLQLSLKKLLMPVNFLLTVCCTLEPYSLKQD